MKDEIKEIINQLEIVARKHTIEVCEDGSKIETMPASVVDELRLSSFSAELLLDYITNLQKIEQEHKNCTRKHWQQKCAEHYANETIYKSRCEEAIKDLKNTKKYNVKLTSEFGDTLVFIDIEHIDYLIEVLGGDNGNMK